MASADQISCRNLGRRSGRRPLRKAQASRRAAKRPRPQPRGMGGNRRKNHPKRRTAPATTQAALSEAESAEREAGQIRFLPDDLRVQHGAQCPEISAKPARAPVGITLTEQHSLEPRPAARQGASRARNCAAISVFSFDGSTAVFFLPPQKENGGGKPSIFIDTPGRSTGPRGGVWSPRPTGAALVVPSSGPMWASAPTGDSSLCTRAPWNGLHRPERSNSGVYSSRAEVRSWV